MCSLCSVLCPELITGTLRSCLMLSEITFLVWKRCTYWLFNLHSIQKPFTTSLWQKATLRASPWSRGRKGGSTWIVSSLWIRLRPNLWKSFLSYFLSINWFFFFGRSIRLWKPMVVTELWVFCSANENAVILNRTIYYSIHTGSFSSTQ